jgi:hypothetical protein
MCDEARNVPGNLEISQGGNTCAIIDRKHARTVGLGTILPHHRQMTHLAQSTFVRDPETIRISDLEVSRLGPFAARNNRTVRSALRRMS